MEFLQEYGAIVAVIISVIALWTKLDGVQTKLSDRQDALAQGIYKRLRENENAMKAHEVQVAERMVTRDELPTILKTVANIARNT